ncbi:MAG: hypothetical protein AAB217_21520, partial [Chloroflexota bacterium]
REGEERRRREEELRKQEEKRRLEEARLQTFVTSMAAFVGLSVAITGVFVGIVEHPSVVMPLVIAGLATIAGGFLIYKTFTKEQPKGVLYKGPNEGDLSLARPTYKYSRELRVYSSAGAIVCIALAIALSFFAYFRSSGTMQPSISVTPTVTPTSTTVATSTTVPNMVGTPTP